MADIVKLIYKGDEMAQGGGSASVDPATTSSAWTVKIATDAQFKAWTEKSWDDYLMPTIPQLFTYNLYRKGSLEFSDWTNNIQLTEKWQNISKTFTMPENWIFVVFYTKEFIEWNRVNLVNVQGSNWSSMTLSETNIMTFSWSIRYYEHNCYFAEKWTTITVSFSSESEWSYSWSDVASWAKKVSLWQYYLKMDTSWLS